MGLYLPFLNIDKHLYFELVRDTLLLKAAIKRHDLFLTYERKLDREKTVKPFFIVFLRSYSI